MRETTRLRQSNSKDFQSVEGGKWVMVCKDLRPRLEVRLIREGRRGEGGRGKGGRGSTGQHIDREAILGNRGQTSEGELDEQQGRYSQSDREIPVFSRESVPPK